MQNHGQEYVFLSKSSMSNICRVIKYNDQWKGVFNLAMWKSLSTFGKMPSTEKWGKEPYWCSLGSESNVRTGKIVENFYFDGQERELLLEVHVNKSLFCFSMFLFSFPLKILKIQQMLMEGSKEKQRHRLIRDSWDSW